MPNAEPNDWKPDRGERIAHFTALAGDFEKHYLKAVTDGDEKKQRIAMAEMARAGLHIQAFMLLEMMDKGELSRDDLTPWELTSIDALDR